MSSRAVPTADVLNAIANFPSGCRCSFRQIGSRPVLVWDGCPVHPRPGARRRPERAVRPPYRAPMKPVFPCRLISTRHCPAVYGDVCGDRPCARYESKDEQPWWPEIVEDV